MWNIPKGYWGDRVCPVCEKTFTPNSFNQVYCCRKCYDRQRRHPIPKKPLYKTIAQIDAEAAEHGMSYGKYMEFLRKEGEATHA